MEVGSLIPCFFKRSSMLVKVMPHILQGIVTSFLKSSLVLLLHNQNGQTLTGEASILALRNTEG